MISASNGPQTHGICTQEDKYIQLILLFFQNCGLLFSNIYPTSSHLNHNQVNILFPFLWKMLWFHPRTIVIKILCFDYFIDMTVMKPIPMTIEMYKYLLVWMKYITALGPPQIVPSWKKIQMDQKSFYHVNILGHELYLLSQMFSLYHKKWHPLLLY